MEDFNNLWIISRLFVFSDSDSKKITKLLEVFFQIQVFINPLFAGNTLIKIDQGDLGELIESLCK